MIIVDSVQILGKLEMAKVCKRSDYHTSTAECLPILIIDLTMMLILRALRFICGPHLVIISPSRARLEGCSL